MNLKFFLEDVSGMPVDLHSRKTCPERFYERIRTDLKHVAWAQIVYPHVIGAKVFTCVKKIEQDLETGTLISYELQKARVQRLPIT